MRANCEQVLLNGTLGELVSQNVDYVEYTLFDWNTSHLTLIHYEFSYLYWQSPITVSKVKGYTCLMSLIPSKRTRRSGPSYSGYANNNC